MPAESNTLSVSTAIQRSFVRGFKTWCENTSVNIRKRMDLAEKDSLDPRELAKNMGVTIMELSEVPNIDPGTVRHLSSAEGDEWSAVTVYTNGKQIIVINPRHSEARKNSNLMHELSHIIRQHEPAKIYIVDDYSLREFNDMQENEANWLAGTLLLSRPALLQIAYSNEDINDTLIRYGVSKSLLNYRMNISGVRKQLSRNSF